MEIGILMAEEFNADTQAVLGPYLGLFAQLLEGHDFTFRQWNVEHMDFPDSPHEADGWLITGSSAGAYDDLPWIAPLEGLIRSIQASNRPLVGICFGHQIIAQALGGRVEKFTGGWCVGRHDYEIGGRAMPLNAWHQDQVVTLPPGARRLGASPFCENAVLAYGDSILTYQPHPEFEAETVAYFTESLKGGSVPDAVLEAARATLAEPTEGPEIGRAIAAHFLRNRG